MQTGLEGYKQWRGGDREAFADTVAAYNKKLIYYVGNLIGSYEEAEDLVSEAFLCLLMKKPSFDSEEQLAAWLFKTARNLCFDLMRKRKTDPFELSDDLPVDGELLSAVVKDETARELHDTMKELSPDYRDVLILLYFGGFSYDQAGAVMKKNTAQIKNLAFRAKQSLKEKLERKGFHYEN